MSPFQKLSFNKTLKLTYVPRKVQQGTLGAEEGPPYPWENLQCGFKAGKDGSALSRACGVRIMLHVVSLFTLI